MSHHGGIRTNSGPGVLTLTLSAECVYADRTSTSGVSWSNSKLTQCPASSNRVASRSASHSDPTVPPTTSVLNRMNLPPSRCSSG